MKTKEDLIKDTIDYLYNPAPETDYIRFSKAISTLIRVIKMQDEEIVNLKERLYQDNILTDED